MSAGGAHRDDPRRWLEFADAPTQAGVVRAKQRQVAEHDVEDISPQLQGRLVCVRRLVHLEALVEEQVLDHASDVRIAVHYKHS